MIYNTYRKFFATFRQYPRNISADNPHRVFNPLTQSVTYAGEPQGWFN